MQNRNQNKSFPLIVLVSLIGILVFVIISSSGSFQNKLFGSLFPKDPSFASTMSGPTQFVLASSSVDLTAPPKSVTPNASGNVTAQVLSVDAVTQLVVIQISGMLNNLTPNNEYNVGVCTGNGRDCSSDNTLQLVTDDNGSLSFDNLNISAYNKPASPISSIRVWENVSGGVAASTCNTVTPCLQADYAVLIISTPAPAKSK